MSNQVRRHDMPPCAGGKEEPARVEHAASVETASKSRPASAGRSEATAAEAVGLRVYLERSDNTVDKPPTDPSLSEDLPTSFRFECCSVGCKNWFCPRCCKHKGALLRERLIPVLGTFKSMVMITLTIDPKLFDSPEKAYWYCKERRAVSELVKALKRYGLVHSCRYFYVVEWQMKGHDGGPPSEMPHFHILLEAPYVDFHALARLWGRNRPASAPAWEGNYEGSLKGTAPEFGAVRVSGQSFKSPLHGARYLTKYLTKPPTDGFPAWVLNSNRQIRRYETSRKFWGESKPRVKIGGNESIIDPTDVESHSEDCRCKACRQVKRPQFPARRRKTIGERNQDCGKAAMILKIKEFLKPDGEVLSGRPQFYESCPIGFEQVRRYFEPTDGNETRFEISEHDLAFLRALRDPLSMVDPDSMPGSDLAAA